MQWGPIWDRSQLETGAEVGDDLWHGQQASTSSDGTGVGTEMGDLPVGGSDGVGSGPATWGYG